MRRQRRAMCTSWTVRTMAKVFIGVGHGGKDAGAVGNGLKEKDINLSIALHLRGELQRHGVTVGISRTKDEDDTTSDEVRKANAFDPDYAVDIHTNAGGGTGFEVLHTISGGKGKTLAANIEAAMVAAGYKSRGLKTKANSAGKDYFGFIRSIAAPSIILECAFIDSSDYKNIDSEADRQKIARAYAKGMDRQKIARAYAKGILKTLGIAYKEEVSSVTKDEAKKIIKEKAGVSDATIVYLDSYRYGDDLILKLAKAMQ